LILRIGNTNQFPRLWDFLYYNKSTKGVFMQTKQLTREAQWALGLTILYMFGWIILAYFFPVKLGILGLPIWFELSCVFLPLLFTLLVYIVVKKVYQNIDLDGNVEE
jgi:hypothetical protein